MASNGKANRTQSPAARKKDGAKVEETSLGANYSVQMGGDSIMPLLLVMICPLLAQILAFISTDSRVSSPTLTGFVAYIQENGLAGFKDALISNTPSFSGCKFLLGFNALAWVLYKVVPGKMESGPLTATGHEPKYADNGFLHCVLYTAIFLGASFGLGLFDAGTLYDEFTALIAALNIFGLFFCAFLTWKGLYMPSTKDCGSSGSFTIDYYWGTELYPRILGVDVKRFVNCRFSMTFWQLAGICYLARSYTLHGIIDYGLLFAALSQYIYLFKFFLWEIGYMRSIDIIVDRAGFYETWGCLVWVPSVYTFHSRICVRSPTQLSFPVAFTIFAVGLAGVLLNYWADTQRQRFRECNGQMLVWGKKPTFVEAKYTVWENGEAKTRNSLLLASGFWGVTRHLHYVFELMAAYSWGLLANPGVNGILALFYPIFLTILLFDRAKRDDEKCSKKYGEYYVEYKKLVPYKIIPGIF
jgi:7-dehydrocholesterol reductase